MPSWHGAPGGGNVPAKRDALLACAFPVVANRAAFFEAAPATVALTIQDDGVGFDAATPACGERRGFGLLGIAERVRLLGGTCAFQSRPGAGTTISIHLPIPASANTDSQQHVRLPPSHPG